MDRRSRFPDKPGRSSAGDDGRESAARVGVAGLSAKAPLFVIMQYDMHGTSAMKTPQFEHVPADGGSPFRYMHKRSADLARELAHRRGVPLEVVTYAQAGPAIRFVRVGTLDTPGRCPPDIHIYTSTKLPWVVLPQGVRAVPEFYDARTVWPAAALDRFRAARARTKG